MWHCMKIVPWRVNFFFLAVTKVSLTMGKFEGVGVVVS